MPPTVAVTDPRHATLFRVERYVSLAPDLTQVYRGLGLQPERGEHRRWIELVQETAREMPRLVRARAVYRIDEVRRLEPQRLELGSNAAYAGHVGRFLAHSRLVATFIVTIGSAPERLSRRWMRRGQILRGTVVDALASELTEAAAERCQQQIRDWAHRQALDITPRYSPGYCGLAVFQQTVVFASLPAAAIRVRLTPSCLMVPIKSVSGLIGIGPADRVSPAGYPCATCGHPTCVQRRAPFGGQVDTCWSWGEHIGAPPEDSHAASDTM